MSLRTRHIASSPFSELTGFHGFHICFHGNAECRSIPGKPLHAEVVLVILYPADVYNFTAFFTTTNKAWSWYLEVRFSLHRATARSKENLTSKYQLRTINLISLPKTARFRTGGFCICEIIIKCGLQFTCRFIGNESVFAPVLYFRLCIVKNTCLFYWLHW